MSEQIVQRALTSYDLMHAEIKKRDAHIAALIAAGDGLAKNLRHATWCGGRGEDTPACDCGVMMWMAAWERAKGEGRDG